MLLVSPPTLLCLSLPQPTLVVHAWQQDKSSCDTTYSGENDLHTIEKLQQRIISMKYNTIYHSKSLI